MVLRLHGAERTAAHVGEMTVLRLFEQVGYAAPRVLPTAAGQMLLPWAEGEGYLTRQIRSLNLTVRELAPDLDFIAQSIRFWNDVEQRIQQLRSEDEGWQKEITARESQ